MVADSAYLGRDVKVVGAKWRYPGIGIIPSTWDGPLNDPGCKCLVSQLDVDPYGRVYAPSAFRFSVEMLDSAGNLLNRIGKYGNVDDDMPRALGGMQAASGNPPAANSTVRSAIHFAWPTVCDYAEADGKLYVSDSVNRRLMVVRFEAAAESFADDR